MEYHNTFDFSSPESCGEIIPFLLTKELMDNNFSA
jgi:hypothetical protein